MYRALRLGANAELILTDNRSFRSEPLTTRAEAAPFRPTEFPGVVSEDVRELLDAGAALPNATPPETIRFGGAGVPNPRRTSRPLSMLRATQKAWFLDRLRAAITAVATLCGDRHAFLAGVLSPTLPPRGFRPVAAEFVTGSISAPGLFEAMELGLPQNHPLRPVYVHQPRANGSAQPAINLSMMDGVRSSLELQRTEDLDKAVAASNPELAPHLSFVDVGGHGYAVVSVSPRDLTVEFVCMPRPIERAAEEDGGPLAYRVSHRVRLWPTGEAPKAVRVSQEGTLPLVP